MTDQELAGLLRPHVRQVVDAAAAGRSPAEIVAALHPALASMPRHVGLELLGRVPELIAVGRERGSGLTAADAPQYANYFAADVAGNYPAELHREFGMGPRAFADATGLRMRFAADGRSFTWVPGERPSAPDDDSPGTDDVDDGGLEHDTGSLDTLQGAVLNARAYEDPDLAEFIARAADDPDLLAQLTGTGPAAATHSADETDEEMQWLTAAGFSAGGAATFAEPGPPPYPGAVLTGKAPEAIWFEMEPVPVPRAVTGATHARISRAAGAHTGAAGRPGAARPAVAPAASQVERPLFSVRAGRSRRDALRAACGSGTAVSNF